MSKKSALKLTVFSLLVGQPLGADSGEAIYPMLQDLNNCQQEALQREQESYKNLRSTPDLSREGQRLHHDLKRQEIRQRQLQHQHRNKAISEQQRALSPHIGPARNSAGSELRRFRRGQEAQRLQFKIQRRSWPVR